MVQQKILPESPLRCFPETRSQTLQGNWSLKSPRRTCATANTNHSRAPPSLSCGTWRDIKTASISSTHLKTLYRMDQLFLEVAVIRTTIRMKGERLVFRQKPNESSLA